MSTKNVPYVKQYDENGKVSNPIIKRYDSGMRSRGGSYQRALCNRKGTRLVVTAIGNGKFTKIKTILQRLPGRTIQHRFMFDNKKQRYLQTK